MNSVSFSSPSSRLPREACPIQGNKGEFQRNLEAYGPVTASAIGVAEAVSDAVSDSASGVVGYGAKAVNGLADTAMKSAHVVGDIVGDVSDVIQAGARYAKQGAEAVGDVLGSAASKTAACAAVGAQTIGALL